MDPKNKARIKEKDLFIRETKYVEDEYGSDDGIWDEVFYGDEESYDD